MFKASSRLLRKADQTRAILSCCIVFWSSFVKQDNGEVTQMKDQKKVADLLKKVSFYTTTGKSEIV